MIKMSSMIEFNYDEENGEVLVISHEEGLHETIELINAIVYNKSTEIEVSRLSNGLSISFPVFIEYFFL